MKEVKEVIKTTRVVGDIAETFYLDDEQYARYIKTGELDKEALSHTEFSYEEYEPVRDEFGDPIETIIECS